MTPPDPEIICRPQDYFRHCDFWGVLGFHFYDKRVYGQVKYQLSGFRP
jgi:hypothetical protein